MSIVWIGKWCNMAYFPMFVNLKDQPCLVVGGGMVAYRKVKVLLDFEARVVVVGENICDKIYEIAKKSNQLELQKIAQSHLSDGWIADAYFGSQNSFFKKDGKQYARATIRRWL